MPPSLTSMIADRVEQLSSCVDQLAIQAGVDRPTLCGCVECVTTGLEGTVPTRIAGDQGGTTHLEGGISGFAEITRREIWRVVRASGPE